MSIPSWARTAYQWCTMKEPALAAGVVASGAVAIVEQIATGQLTLSAGLPLVGAALARQFVFAPAHVVAYRKDEHTVTQGPGA